MGLFPACNLPWIDATVNKYVKNIPQFRSNVDAIMCCLTPGDCTVNSIQGNCPLGYLDCNFGNSRYACSFLPPTGQGPRCWTEGTLTHTRNLPCCQSHLYEFMKTQPCMGGYSTASNSSMCCTGKDANSCKMQIGCPGLSTDGAICHGYTDVLGETCVSEFGLDSEVFPNCLTTTIPSSGCALGGSGPALPPGGAITTSAPPSTTAAPTPTGPIELPKSAGGKNVAKKWLALCMVAPALLQMVFL
ncbi:hypothetical protein BGZ74_001736 [Mortierella antarctica]|nr:hypothetical protein BGZ74_001736 [Mortierella antarctica]